MKVRCKAMKTNLFAVLLSQHIISRLRSVIKVIPKAHCKNVISDHVNVITILFIPRVATCSMRYESQDLIVARFL